MIDRWVRGLLLMCLLGSTMRCSLSHPLYPRPPMYPGAQQITVDRSEPALRIVRFQTADVPSTVMTYFDSELRRADWEADPSTVPDTQRYSYMTRWEDHAPMFSFSVTAESTQPGRTDVELHFFYVGPNFAFPDDYHFPEGYQ